MRSGGESGQAMVEAAIVLPALVFLLLLSLQLTQLQQARLMVEYAAFNAARTGIVRNADNGASNGFDGPMHEAAVLSVLPTFGRADSFGQLGRTLLAFKAQEAALKPFGLSPVRVHVLSPAKADFPRLGAHLHGRELDFDDVRPEAAEATLLSVQVRYLYELRVPFANRMIQTLWMALRTGTLRGWGGSDWSSPRLGGQAGRDAVEGSRLIAFGTTVPDGTPEGISLGALVAAGRAGRFLLPVEAFSTMRMQSNPFARWAHP